MTQLVSEREPSAAWRMCSIYDDQIIARPTDAGAGEVLRQPLQHDWYGQLDSRQEVDWRGCRTNFASDARFARSLCTDICVKGGNYDLVSSRSSDPTMVPENATATGGTKNPADTFESTPTLQASLLG